MWSSCLLRGTAPVLGPGCGLCGVICRLGGEGDSRLLCLVDFGCVGAFLFCALLSGVLRGDGVRGCWIGSLHCCCSCC